jgi:sugar PTS system EIIA component
VSLRVGSPVAGRVVPLSAVPDPVFSQAMVGPGVAVEPTPGKSDVVSPVDGTVVTLHPHAFVVATGDGAAVLVHLGIDTVKRKGEGFTLHVVKGETVRAGQPVVTWDPAEVEAAGYAPICPVIALDATAEALGELATSADVSAGDALFDWSR